MDPGIAFHDGIHYPEILLLLFLLFLSAFFSLSEVAFISVSRERLFILARDGLSVANSAINLVEKRDRIISIALLCSNIVNVSASSISAIIFHNIFPKDEGLSIVISSALVTIVIFMFGEVLPKMIGCRRSTSIVLSVTPLFEFLMKITYPLIYSVELLNKKIINIFNIKFESDNDKAEDSILGTVEIFHQKGDIKSTEKEMLSGVLSLDNIDIKDIMTHRNDTVAIDINDSKDEILNQILESIYIRIPVYDETLDNVLGILHIKDFYLELHKYKGDFEKVDIIKLLHKPLFMPGDASLISQLSVFKKENNHLGFVVDEHGGVMGIITLEDIVEQIVGDIHDNNEEEIIQLEDNGNVAIVKANITLLELNEKFYSNFKDDEVSTIAGLIINKLERIPSKNEELIIDNYNIEILETKVNKIVKVKIKKIDNNN